MGTKTLNKKKPSTTRVGAVTKRGWTTLCKKALAAAQKAGDRRALGIQAALEKGTEAKTLKTMNIICEADINREFSNPRT